MASRPLDRGDADARFMARALALAERYRGRTSPNPTVGCVIVDRRGRVVGEGAHAGPGTPHAEIIALDRAGKRARGATMYVTLEPCTHYGRTPPCAPVVRDAGLARVVIGSLDPVRGHGGGLGVVKRAGIAVGRALVTECDAAILPFRIWATERRPMFTLKAAVTLDGKLATVGGQSQWITGQAARDDAHRLRDTHDAVLVGIGTVLADNPRLTARLPGARDPMRIVLDSRLRTPPNARLLPQRRNWARTVIVCGPGAAPARERALVRAGAEVWRLPARRDGRVALARLASKLGAEGITSVLVEGGAEVHASVLERGFADQIVLYIAPKIVGGPAPSWVGGPGLETLDSAHRFAFGAQPAYLGDDLRVVLVPPRPTGAR
jgi:diaminohydroxyphosphoribosylaminopyrimidine deaminase/5-amino-6-(5-phosphoribosylamino)uracil reductase